MEMEKISGSFPYVNRNPEFRWKPYRETDLIIDQFLWKYRVYSFNSQRVWKDFKLSPHNNVCMLPDYTQPNLF